MTDTQVRNDATATADGPVVVIPEPIGIMDWSYEVERSMLEPLGIRLVIPADRDEAREAMRTADVVFTSSSLTADDIATFDNAVGIVCYSVGMDYVDAKAAAAKVIWNCPTSNNEEVSDHGVLLILAAQRRLLQFANAAAQGDWEIYTWPVYQELHRTGRGRWDHRPRADRPPDRTEAAGLQAHDHRLRPVYLRQSLPRGRIGLARRALCAGGHHRVLGRTHGDVPRDHRCGDAREDEAGRADRQRLPWRDRRGAGAS